MAPSVSVAIPYEPVAGRKSGDLQSEVQKIVERKGQFWKVTERSLLDDIQRRKTVGNDDDNDAEAGGSEVAQDTFEKLWQSRKEMHERIGNALNEALSVLDAISLTASGHSATAQATMSPALKQLVPVGGFRPKLTEPAELTLRAKKRLNDLSLVSKSQSFQAASKKFEDALQRLQTQAESQSKYWEEIVALRNNGWQVSRLPHDKRAIVVHLGATDASPQFQSRGIAPIRQNDNGDVFVPGHTDTRKPKLLFVQVSRDRQITGHFLSQQKMSDSSSKVNEDLLRVREALFAGELFTEASKEARLIANNGVQARSSSITFDVPDGSIVKIGYSPNPPVPPNDDRPDDELAAVIGNILRLMLVAEYQQRYSQRSQHPPPTMTQITQASPESMILRPIITLLRHHQMITPVLTLLEGYRTSLTSADLSISYNIEHTTANTPDHSSLRALKQVLTTTIKMQLPSDTSLSASIETFLSPPRFGTVFSVQEYRSACGNRALHHSSSLEAMKQMLSDILSRDVSSVIIQHINSRANFDEGDIYPIQFLLQHDEIPQLSLAVRCENGILIMASLRDGEDLPRQVTWGGETSKDQQRVQSLLSIAESWVAEILQI